MLPAKIGALGILEFMRQDGRDVLPVVERFLREEPDGLARQRALEILLAAKSREPK